MNPQIRTVLLTAPFSALLAAPAMAQERPMYELPKITVTALEGEHPLYAQAVDLYDDPARWDEAAELHKKAADAFPNNDAASYDGYDRAARLFFYVGDYGDARTNMEKAAHVAEASGDIVTAAYRYVDAAFIAVWEGYPGKRRELTATADKLAESPKFGDEDRYQIDALIRGVGALPETEAD